LKIWDVFLLSVALAALYQGQLIFRRGGARRRIFAVMLMVDGLAALLGFAAFRDSETAADAPLIASVALGAFVFLVLVPPRLRWLARWATRHDHLGLALHLLGAHELLQPGMGAREEREALSAFAELRQGKTERAVEALRLARAEARDPMQRRAVDERIVFAYLTARRWRSAVEHFERSIEAQPGPISANVLVEVLRAYGELGERARAADLMTRIEDSGLTSEPQLEQLVARARMVFLAFAGRAAAVEAMVAPRGSLAQMPPSARAYWIGVARREAGDAAGARIALTTAVQASAGDARARSIAADELAELDKDETPPEPLPEEIARLADRVGERAVLAPTPRAQGAPVPQLDGVSWRQVPVTVTLIGVNLAVAALVQALLGSSTDSFVMVRAGANAHALTQGGEWWRLVSSMFLHFGALHLAVNMYGLWVLGRVVEQIHGRRRYFVVYMIAGIGGSLASLYLGQYLSIGHRAVGISAGASGAIFGVLGAAIAEFALRRKAYPEAWRRAVLGNLVFLAAANVFIGQAIQGIDQAAHLGGLVSGALAGALLAPRGAFGRLKVARPIVAVLAATGVALLAATAWAVVRDNGWHRHSVAGWSVEEPGFDRFVMMPFAASDISDDALLADTMDAFVQASARAGTRITDLEDARPVVHVDGWVTREQRGTAHEDHESGPVRVVAAVRRAPDGSRLLVTFVAPERDLDSYLRVARRVLSSARAPE
jgi:membrane associated rhomboid family serine protease